MIFVKNGLTIYTFVQHVKFMLSSDYSDWCEWESEDAFIKGREIMGNSRLIFLFPHGIELDSIES